MKPAAFDYVRAETSDEAVQQLKALGPEARIGRASCRERV